MAVGIVLAPAGTAKPPTSEVKKYDACLQYSGSPDCAASGAHTILPGGSTVPLQLKITNELASNQTLGSANVNAPAGLPIDPTQPVTSSIPGTIGSPPTSSQIQLRNLNLAPDASVIVNFSVTTPCSGGPFTWLVPAKQSNNFLGTGNDFSLILAAGLISDVQGCLHVEFMNQPKRTGLGQTITDADFSTGGPIKVGLFDQNDQLVTTCLAADCSVTMSRAPGLGSFDGTLEQPLLFDSGAGGLVASFGDLSISGLTTVPQEFTLTASGLGTTDTSDPFDIASYTDCTTQSNGCQTDPLVVDGTTFTQAQTSSNDFVFIGIDTLDLGNPCAAQNFSPVGAAPIVVIDQRETLSGDIFVTYGIKKTLIKKKYANTQGEQFLPICGGAKRIRLNESGVTEAVPCNETYDGQSQAGTGWWGKSLNTEGKFDGNLSQAVCDSQSGFFFGILGSFQDYTNSNPSLIIDPSWSPTVVSWTSDTTYRYFTIRYPAASGPSGSAFDDVPWDGWNFG